jgi:hypothetical protein
MIFTSFGIRGERSGQPVIRCLLSTTVFGGTQWRLTIGRMRVHDLVKHFRLRPIISLGRQAKTPKADAIYGLLRDGSMSITAEASTMSAAA